MERQITDLLSLTLASRPETNPCLQLRRSGEEHLPVGRLKR
jgi:hypothetical protein